jgi:minor extracellular serine protease Vpr
MLLIYTGMRGPHSDQRKFFPSLRFFASENFVTLLSRPALRSIFHFVLGFALAVSIVPHGFADTTANKDSQANLAFAKYGLTGKGVIVAILDRGIDYTHPDFRNTDGTTRIKMMWDMSGQDLCASNNPAPVVYTEAQINAALSSNTPLAERDAVGHGTVTAGIAAGNGSAVKPTSAQWAGFAPEADLLIVKVTSEGAPAHGTQAAEAPFQGCYSQALDLVSEEAATLGEPIVALINSGTQWGPIDGTSAVSSKIDLDFGPNTPGYVYVEASGDEGDLNNHARSTFGKTAKAFPFTKSSTDAVDFQIWYTGADPAKVTLTMSDTGATATVAPGNNCSTSTDGSIELCQYLPGQQFYPWTSSGPDRAVWINVTGHTGAGSLTIQGTGSGIGTADVYGDSSGIISYTKYLTPGRLTDYSSTTSAIVSGCYNIRTEWTDIDGDKETLTNEGGVGALWTGSSGGPTRDGRIPPNGGVDIVSPGGNIFAAYGINSYWETFTGNLIQGGGGYYGRQSATSGASPILQGTAALLLQMNPNLTSSQIRSYIHQSALTDKFTGTTPNEMWGLGKINVLGAANLVAAALNTNPTLSTTTLTFPATIVGDTSAAQTVTFSNAGTATNVLGITAISASGDFHIKSNNCGSSLAVGASCKISITFKPTTTGTQTGTLTIKDFNTNSPHTVALTGTGD